MSVDPGDEVRVTSEEPPQPDADGGARPLR
jgi:hypothetical protein